MTGRDVDALQGRVVAFVRAFGLHRGDETPCGTSVPVSEAHALSVLYEAGPLSQNELAKHLQLTKSTVSRLVDQLSKRSWVQRRVGDTDARQRLIELTARGRAAAAQLAAHRADRMRRLLERIPENQRDAVIVALDALVAAADEE